ncbi:restriction endonuclease subunit S [Cycloclasticus pugetii]|uniref:restriction endonuclease subunit S n=1 Tax=Cycloclasticus pugetii TaxID=34068 RepID=UPI00090FB9D2|nr:restriction endonuclease subunit S [Cycloclasticus pugetii]SHJ32223.1 type I restriction enzyme, S subunit [Cycloclasticus pugetii]
MSNLAQQQVPEGYQQTEVGLIPKAWEVKEIGAALSIRHGRDQKHVECDDGLYPILGTGGEMGRTNAFLYDKPSVLIGRKGTINKPRYIDSPFWTVDTLFYSEVDKKYFAKFVYYKFCMIDWMTYNEASGVPSLNASTIENVQLSFPGSKEEQTAISNALSDVDALITSLEKLIAKKRAIKTAAMQQLLTGKKRLPPFDQTHTGYKQTELGEIPEDWEVVELEKLAHVRTGSMNNQDKVEDGVYPFYVRSQNVERINSYSYECEAILVPGEGNIGNIFHYVNGRFDAHQRVYVIRQFDEECSAKYIFYYMNETFGRHAMENSVKATVDSLRLPTFLGYKLAKPERLEEQMAIAAVLTDMDKEIKEVKQRLNKTQQLKQGMMQELLTGKTRLITKTTS